MNFGTPTWEKLQWYSQPHQPQLSLQSQWPLLHLTTYSYYNVCTLNCCAIVKVFFVFFSFSWEISNEGNRLKSMARIDMRAKNFRSRFVICSFLFLGLLFKYVLLLFISFFLSISNIFIHMHNMLFSQYVFLSVFGFLFRFRSWRESHWRININYVLVVSFSEQNRYVTQITISSPTIHPADNDDDYTCRYHSKYTCVLFFLFVLCFSVNERKNCHTHTNVYIEAVPSQISAKSSFYA